MEIRPILSALLRNKTGAFLVALQVALSLAILANALHIVNERRAAAARPSGIADEASVFAISLRELAILTPEQQLAAHKRARDTLRAVAGVAGVAATTQVPMSESGWTSSVAADRKQANESASASQYMSADPLVATLGLKLVEGRDFLPQEIQEINETSSDENPRTVIITRALAQKMWPGTAVVGKTMYLGTGEGAMDVRIVGVVERLQTQGAEVSESGEFSLIMPVRLYGARPNSMFVVRAQPGQRERVIKEAEAALRAASATPLIVRTKTIDAVRKERYRADTAMSWMLITVSVLLLLITASGIVGTASLWVTQRRKQIGVRRALGARRIDILRYFLTENFIITSSGVVGGVLLGVALNQLLVSKLEMARLPIEYLAGGAAVLLALGVLAVYGPAWRAASISPALATRSV